MNAFESLVSLLLRRQGYWTTSSFKVEMTKEEKARAGRASSPRWEIDLVAYQGSTNQVLAVECKSYFDSAGVQFRNGNFEPPKLYKLFTDGVLREIVLRRLATQLVASGACGAAPRVTLCLAAGKIHRNTDESGMKQHFESNGWKLFKVDWLQEQLQLASQSGYENDIAFIVSKILLRK